MSNFDNLDVLSQQSVTQSLQSDNSFIGPDLNIPESIVGQAAANAQVNSYDSSVNTMQAKLNQGFLDRQNLLLENNIHPVVDLSDGIDQDKLDALDQQIEKINGTTRLNNPIMTNDQVKQKVKNDYLRSVYEKDMGAKNENMVERAASSALGWVESIPYDYKKDLIDAGAMAGTTAAAMLSGGSSLAVEATIGGLGMSAQATADQARQNPALRLIGLPPQDLFKTAENSFISGAVSTAGAIVGGKLIGKVVKKAISRFVASDAVEGLGTSSAEFSPPSATKFKNAGLEYDAGADLKDEEEEGVNPNKSEMYVSGFRDMSDDMKSAMQSDNPSIRAAAQDRILKTNPMSEDLGDNETSCRLRG